MKILCIDDANRYEKLFAAIAAMMKAECCIVSWKQFFGSDLPAFPQTAADSIWKYISSDEYIAVIACQTPMALRCLSILAASAHVPFYKNVRSSDLPMWRRTVCASRILDTQAAPNGPFCASILDDGIPNDEYIYISESFPPYKNDIIIPDGEFESFKNALVQLDSARIVFAGGRGLGSKVNFEKLEACAHKFGAGLAASRLAVDLGWARCDMQVGQTGRSISPDIYVAFGISGAVQHIAGIQNAKYIYAVNNDKLAPIFSFADAGVIADAMTVIDKLLNM